MSTWTDTTVDGQPAKKIVMPAGTGTSGAFEAALGADIRAAMWALTTKTDHPYGFYDPFADANGLSALAGAAVSGGYVAPTSSGGGSSGDITPTMTGYTTPSGEVWYSAQDAAYPAWKAFNKSNADAWGAFFSGNSPRLAYAFASPQLASGITLQAHSANLPYGPTAFTVSGSNDATGIANGTWTDIKTFTTGAWTNDTEVRTFLFDAAVSYSRIRLTVTNASGTVYACISEMGILGVSTPVSINASTIVSVADTASALPTHAMGLLWLDAKGAPVADSTETNNAIRLYLSRDDSATWDWLPLSDEGVVFGDVRRYACADKTLSAASGTSIKLKLTSHDLGSGAPDFALHGWGCVYDAG